MFSLLGSEQSRRARKPKYLASWEALNLSRSCEASLVDPRDGWRFVGPEVVGEQGFSVTDYYQMGVGNNIDGSSTMTRTILFRYDQNNGATQILLENYDSGGGGYLFQVSSGDQIQWVIYDSGGTPYSLSSDPIKTGSIYCATATWDNTNLRLVVDQVSTSSAPGATYSPATSTAPGLGSHSGGGLPADGCTIIGVSLSDGVALTEEQARAYNAKNLRLLEVQTYSGLENLWKSPNLGTDALGSLNWSAVGSTTTSSVKLSWLPSNMGRILPDGAILIEGQRTNRILENREPVTATTEWDAGSLGAYTGTVNYERGPDGILESDRIESVGSSFSRGQNPSGLTNPHIVSAYGRATSGTSIWAANYAAATAWNEAALGEEWTRKSVLREGTGHTFYPVDSSLPSGTPQDVLVDLVQAENGKFISSPVRVSGATVTRWADFASRIGPELFGDKFFKDGFEVDVWPLFDSTDIEDRVIFSAHSGSLHHLKFSSGSISFSAGGRAVKSSGHTWAELDKITLRVEFDNDLKILINDSLDETLDISGWGDWTSRSSSAWWVGNISSVSEPFFGVISRPKTLSPEASTKFLADWRDADFTRASFASLSDPRRGWRFTHDALEIFKSKVEDGGGNNLHPRPGEESWENSFQTPLITTGAADLFGGNSAVIIEDEITANYEIAANATKATPTSTEPFWWCWAVKRELDAGTWTEVQLYEGASQRVLISVNKDEGAWQVRAGSITKGELNAEMNLLNGWWVFTARINSGEFTGGTANIETRVHGAAGNTPFTLAVAATGSTTFYGPYFADASIPENNPRGWAVHDEPRIFRDGAVLIEGSRENLVGEFTNFSNWDNQGSLFYSSSNVSPDGSHMWTIEDDQPASATAMKISVGDIAAGNYALSVYTPKNSISKFRPAIGIQSASVLLEVSIDTTDGDIAVARNTSPFTGSIPVPIVSSSITPDYYRIATVLKSVTAGESFVRLMPSTFSGTNSLNTSLSGVVDFWGVQLESSDFVTSPIRTSGSSATRAFDDLDMTDGSAVFADAFFSEGFEIDIWPLFASADTANRIIIANNAGFSYLRFNSAGGFHYRAGTAASPGAEKASAAVTYSVGDKVTLRVEHGVDVKIFVNGSLQTTLDISSGAGPGWDSAQTANSGWQVGNYSGGQVLFGVVSRPRALYPFK